MLIEESGRCSSLTLYQVLVWSHYLPFNFDSPWTKLIHFHHCHLIHIKLLLLLTTNSAFNCFIYYLLASHWAIEQESYARLVVFVSTFLLKNLNCIACNRIEILGARVSIQLIWVLAGIWVYEAILRLISETGEVNGFLMFLVAAFGLVVNIIIAVMLGHSHGHGHSHDDHGRGHSHGDNHAQDVVINPRVHAHEHHYADDEHHHHHDHYAEHAEPLLKDSSGGHENGVEDGMGKNKGRSINVQSAYLHVLGDSIQSVGVMIGVAIIWIKPEWKIIDPISTLLFSVIALGTTIKMLRDILEVLMESTPREIDATKLQTRMLEMEEVIAIHELHIWAITVGKVLLACHVKIRPEANADMVLDKVIEYIKREYNTSHVTIQIER
ncbi:Metal tolerance protein 1-like protein [Drosera capensis]